MPADDRPAVAGGASAPDGAPGTDDAEARPRERSHLLLLGGRSGVGKSTVAATLHAVLRDRDVRHAVIEGDALDLAHPVPWEHRLAERNLAAVWANYRALGYRRLVYTNTVSVLEAADLAAAMGDDPHVTPVLLTGEDDAVRERLCRREHGDQLRAHLQRSAEAAAELEAAVPASVHRLATDGLTPDDVAARVLALVGW